jgi:hypothetical protein
MTPQVFYGHPSRGKKNPAQILDDRGCVTPFCNFMEIKKTFWVLKLTAKLLLFVGFSLQKITHNLHSAWSIAGMQRRSPLLNEHPVVHSYMAMGQLLGGRVVQNFRSGKNRQQHF